MSRSGQDRRGTAAARLLSLLAVLLGLLAMHGLASTHHAAASTTAQALSATASVGGQSAGRLDRGQPQSHDHTASGASASTAMAGSLLERAVVGPAVPGCGDDCTGGLVMLCAAVVAAAAAALSLIAVAGRRLVATPVRRGPRARVPARARRLPPRLDPVAELCVSRT